MLAVAPAAAVSADDRILGVADSMALGVYRIDGAAVGGTEAGFNCGENLLLRGATCAANGPKENHLCAREPTVDCSASPVTGFDG